MAENTKYVPTIGLEVHIQLSTQSKLFASDATGYGQPPNTQVSVITLAHPGTMPKLNKKAVELAVRMGLACESEISRYCIFDRKNYFYPDLPKGFQTTQDRTPICIGGAVPIKVEDQEIAVKLNRIHLEEDAGKSIHSDASEETHIDLNRAGMPLIELVTEPVIHSAEEAMVFLTEIRRIIRYLDICDGNMEEGSMRCDANVSLRNVGDKELGKKVEVKNMNSIRNVGRAIQTELKRQEILLNQGEEIISETRLYDAAKNQTFGMRTKEELNDYRYFPEPDLSPFTVSDEWLEEIQHSMHDTPRQTRKRFQREYGLSEYDTGVLTDEKQFADFFEEVYANCKQPKAIANWIMGPVKSAMNEASGTVSMPVSAEQLADLIQLVEEGKINFSLANKQVFPELLGREDQSVATLVERLGLTSTHEVSLSDVIKKILQENPDQVKAYQHGKKNLLGMFMGEVMKKTKGKADPQKTNELLRSELQK